MTERHSFEFSKEVLDQGNDLTGPDDENKASYPRIPKNVSIQSTEERNGK
ncbi:hypothetical protein [Heyndrickxia camelliae]|nr:hypothetical protein [Heyndrickxia camelliae]